MKIIELNITIFKYNSIYNIRIPNFQYKYLITIPFYDINTNRWHCKKYLVNNIKLHVVIAIRSFINNFFKDH